MSEDSKMFLSNETVLDPQIFYLFYYDNEKTVSYFLNVFYNIRAK